MDDLDDMNMDLINMDELYELSDAILPLIRSSQESLSKLVIGTESRLCFVARDGDWQNAGEIVGSNTSIKELVFKYLRVDCLN